MNYNQNILKIHVREILIESKQREKKKRSAKTESSCSSSILTQKGNKTQNFHTSQSPQNPNIRHMRIDIFTTYRSVAELPPRRLIRRVAWAVDRVAGVGSGGCGSRRDRGPSAEEEARAAVGGGAVMAVGLGLRILVTDGWWRRHVDPLLLPFPDWAIEDRGCWAVSGRRPAQSRSDTFHYRPGLPFHRSCYSEVAAMAFSYSSSLTFSLVHSLTDYFKYYFSTRLSCKQVR